MAIDTNDIQNSLDTEIFDDNGKFGIRDKKTKIKINPPELPNVDTSNLSVPPSNGEPVVENIGLAQPPPMGLNSPEEMEKIAEDEDIKKRATGALAAGSALPAAGALMTGAGDIGRAANAYTAGVAATPAFIGGTVLPALHSVAPLGIPIQGAVKTAYDYATNPALSAKLKDLFATDQSKAREASQGIGENLATNTLKPVSVATNVGGDLLSALQGALSKTGQFVGENVVSPIVKTADTGLGAVKNVTTPILNSNIAKILEGALSMTAYGPAAGYIQNALTNKAGEESGYGAEGGKRNDYFNEYHPQSASVESALTTVPMDREINAVDMQISRMTMKLMAGDRSVIPQLNSLQTYKNSIVKNKQETIAATEAQRKQSQDYGNYVTGSKEHEAMTTESNALKKIDNVATDLNEAADRQDGRSVGAIGQQLVDFIRTTTNQAVTEGQRETLNPLLTQAHGLLSVDAHGNSTVAPENIPVMLRTIAGIRKELATDLDSYVSRPNSGIDAKTKEYLFSNPNVKTNENTAAKRIEVNIPGHGPVHGALAVDKDGHSLAIDPETGYPYRLAQDGKTIMGVEMKSGKLADPMNLNTYIAGKNGEPLTGKVPDSDKIATYAYIGAPQAKDENGNPAFDSFGFMIPDTAVEGILVPKRTGNEDSFNVVYNKLVNPSSKSASEASNQANISGLQNRATLDSMLSRMRDVNATGAGLSAIAKSFGLNNVSNWIDSEMAKGRNVNYQDLAKELAGGKISTPSTSVAPTQAPKSVVPQASAWTAQDEQRLANFTKLGNTQKVAELQAKKKKAGK